MLNTLRLTSKNLSKRTIFSHKSLNIIKTNKYSIQASPFFSHYNTSYDQNNTFNFSKIGTLSAIGVLLGLGSILYNEKNTPKQCEPLLFGAGLATCLTAAFLSYDSSPIKTQSGLLSVSEVVSKQGRPSPRHAKVLQRSPDILPAYQHLGLGKYFDSSYQNIAIVGGENVGKTAFSNRLYNDNQLVSDISKATIHYHEIPNSKIRSWRIPGSSSTTEDVDIKHYVEDYGLIHFDFVIYLFKDNLEEIDGVIIKDLIKKEVPVILVNSFYDDKIDQAIENGDDRPRYQIDMELRENEIISIKSNQVYQNLVKYIKDKKFHTYDADHYYDIFDDIYFIYNNHNAWDLRQRYEFYLLEQQWTKALKLSRNIRGNVLPADVPTMGDAISGTLLSSILNSHFDPEIENLLLHRLSGTSLQDAINSMKDMDNSLKNAIRQFYSAEPEQFENVWNRILECFNNYDTRPWYNKNKNIIYTIGAIGTLASVIGGTNINKNNQPVMDNVLGNNKPNLQTE